MKGDNINESIVLVGGGSGVYQIARFLKKQRPNITTIQSVFDHGGHSGTLRDERGVLPPGDLRRAILALSDEDMEPTLRKLLSHRFEKKGSCSLDDANVGNILLTALVEIEGNLPRAIEALSKLCGVKGNVLPVSLDNAELCAILSDGSTVCGEDKIDTRVSEDDRKIENVFLSPEAKIFSAAKDALIHADKIVFCPGDLYTSLVPNLLVTGFKEALQESEAKLIYIPNIMTKKSETDGFTGADFVKVVREAIGKNIDVCIANSGNLSEEMIEKYKQEKACPVIYDDSVYEYAEKLILDDLVEESGGIVRHNERVAELIAATK